MLGLGLKAKFSGLDLGLKEQVLGLACQALVMYCAQSHNKIDTIQTNPEETIRSN